MITVLEVPKADTYIYFSITCITAPTLGAAFSGVICSKLGGYDGAMTVPSCIFSAFACVMAAIFVPAVNDFRWLIFLIWTMLFMGGYTLPVLTGVMLN